MSNQNRKPKGAPAKEGGQFAGGSHDEAVASLAPDMEIGDRREAECSTSRDLDPAYAPDRATHVAQKMGILATVERAADATDWRGEKSPAYIVTLRAPVDAEGDHTELSVYISGSKNIPTREDAMEEMVWRSAQADGADDEEDYARQSDMEYEEAISEYHALREDRDAFYDFVGADNYIEITEGK